ncbi:MAG: 50S ribosomal protein L25 [Muribaculaceae bacterium]|nr:50S ribosomal protein L25 [Muribaculaceae bacterium]MDE6360200.1 50S ribosomal protein L25 [Muribaculaceae bacterium]
MKSYELKATPRVDLGKKAAKALRAEGKIPAVLNGGEIVELPFKGNLKEGEKLVEIENGRGIITTDLTLTNESVRKLIYTPEIFAIDLDINGEKKTAVLREVQFHPVKDNILHIDLLEVKADKPVVMSVPVKLEGHAEGVKAGGKLTLSMKKIKVRAPYTEIPERLVINVDHLGLGKTLQVGELHFEGLEMVTPKEAVVCAVQLTRAARGAAAAEAAAAKK